MDDFDDSVGRWFVPLDPRPDADVRVFAFPHVGAGCSAFAKCAEQLPPGLELWALNLPGRQARFLEPPKTELLPLVDELAERLRPSLGSRYALVGFCSGALLAFLVARRLRAAGAPPPERLIVVSQPAPDLPAWSMLPALHLLPADAFWAKVQAFGGLPDELLAEQGYREVLEPALRADFGLLAQYRYTAEPPLDLPITVVAGRADHHPLDELSGWVRQTDDELVLRLLVADHWVPQHAPRGLAAAIGRDLSLPHRAPAGSMATIASGSSGSTNSLEVVPDATTSPLDGS